MGIFGRSRDVKNVTATVTAAGAPPQNLTARHYADWVFVVADLGDGPTLLRSVVRLDRDRWLVPGMTVPIEIDPQKTDAVHAFTIDWDAVPTIQERVAANDPTLADPRAARRRAHELRHGAADAAHAPKGLLSKFEQPLFGIGQNTIAPSSGFSTDTDSWSAAYDDALEQAKTLPAPAGMQRAVVVITAMRMVFRNLGHHLDGTPDLLGDSNQSSFEAALTGNEVVLAVTVPGQPPYAVFQPGFKAPHGKPVTQTPNLYPWLPALVSVSDRTAVEIVWDEVADEMGKVAETSQHAYDDAAARQQSVLDAYTQGRAGTLPLGPATALAPGALTDPMQRAAAVAAAVGSAQAAFAAPNPDDPDAGSRVIAKQRAAMVAAATPSKRAEMLGNFRSQLSKLPPEESEKLAGFMRDEGLDV